MLNRLCVCAVFLLLPLQLATAQTIPADFDMASGASVVSNGADSETLLSDFFNICMTCLRLEDCVCGNWRPPFGQPQPTIPVDPILVADPQPSTSPPTPPTAGHHLGQWDPFDDPEHYDPFTLPMGRDPSSQGEESTVDPRDIEMLIAGPYNPGDRTGPSRPRKPRKRRAPRKDDGYLCPHEDCDKRYSLLSELKRHEKIHQDKAERPHKCRTCNEAFWYPKDLRRHEQLHINQDAVYLCPVDECPSATKGYRRADNLRRHIRDKHPGMSPPAASGMSPVNTSSISDLSPVYTPESLF